MTASSGLSPLARSAAWLLLPALFLAGCSQSKPAEEPVRAVKLVTVGTSDFDAQPEFSAEVRARVESRLGFRVAGKITKRQAELGQHVQAGQVLAQLDPQDYRLAAEAARAQLAAAQTNRDLAAADLKRYTELRSQNFISGAELERRESTWKAAQAQLEQAQAQLSSQGNQASYTTLVADVAGVITAIEAEPGQVVQAGTPVVRIAQDGARDVVFAVPEDRAALLLAGFAGHGARLVGRRRTAGPSARSGGKRRRGHSHLRGQGCHRCGHLAGARCHRLCAPASIGACGRCGHEAADERAAPGRQGHVGLGAGQGHHDGAFAAGAGGHGRRQ